MIPKVLIVRNDMFVMLNDVDDDDDVPRLYLCDDVLYDVL